MTITSNPPDWLDLLSNHPITTPPSSKSDPDSRKRNPCSRSRNLLAYHDGLLVVCITSDDGFESLGNDEENRNQGKELNPGKTQYSIIRILNLTEWKRKVSKIDKETPELYEGSSYKELILDAVNFPIRQISLSNNGALLACRGDTSIVVAVMPLSARSSSIPSVECRCFSVGGVYYGDADDIFISKVLWHPLSDTSSHLAILSTDGYMRLFDVSVDIDEPEQHFQIHSWSSSLSVSTSTTSTNALRRRNTHVFGPDTQMAEPISFDFGTSTENNAWASFTCYVACRNGDIYSICPVLPQRCRIPMSLPLQLQLENDVDWNEETLERREKGQDEDLDAQTHFYWRSKWVSDLVQQVLDSRASEDQLLQEEILSVRAPSSLSKFSVAIQGPFLIQPGLQGEDADLEALDLMYRYDGSVSALVVSFTESRIFSFVLGTNVIAKWDLVPSHAALNKSNADQETSLLPEEKLPLLLVQDIVNLNQEHINPILHPDKSSPSCLFAFHERGVDRIDLKWLNELASSSSDSLSNTTTNTETVCYPLVKTPSSTNCNQSKSIEGFCIVSDVYLGHVYILLSPEGFLYGQSLPMTSLSVRKSVNHATVASAAADSSTKPLLYKSFLQNQGYIIPQILSSGFPRQPIHMKSKSLSAGGKSTVSGTVFPEFLDEESMKIATESGNLCREDVQVLYNAMADLQEHVERQIQEHATQKLILSEIQSRISSLAQFQARIQDISQRHEKLVRKSDLILEILLDLTQPELSPAEIRFISELENKYLLMKNEIRPSVRQLSKKWEQLRKSSNTITSTTQHNITTPIKAPIGMGVNSLFLSALRGQRSANVNSPSKQPAQQVLGQDQQTRLSNALKQEYQILSYTASKLEHLLERLAL